MKRYSVFHPFVLAFYSPELYRDVAQNWSGIGLSYLLLLLTLCTVPKMIKVHAGISQFVTQEAPKLVKQIPPITIHNGEVSVDVPMPYVINDPDTHEPLAIIDTTGETTSLGNSKARALLTKSNLIVENGPAGPTKTYDLSNVKDFSLDQARIYRWLDIMKNWLVIVFYPFVVLFTLVSKAIKVLVYALIGLLFAKTLEVRLEYDQLMRLAAVALTPVVILDTALGLASVRAPHWSLICFALELVYLWFAVKANQGMTPAPSAPPPLPTGNPAPPANAGM